MKYCVVILDGAAGWPLPERGGRTSFELAHTPNLDAITVEGTLGMVRTVPVGLEPSSTYACLRILGYDPRSHHMGRAAIEAASMGIEVAEDEVLFRCNLVSVRDGKMFDYSSGHISKEESHQLVAALNQNLGRDDIHVYPGVSYRHILKLKDHAEMLSASCTPPHDIPNQPVSKNMPTGQGSELLRDLMERSVPILEAHPVNKARVARGEAPANMMWLFWGTRRIPPIVPFKKVYGLRAALTSGVDLLRGMGILMGMDILDIAGVTDSIDNDDAAQAAGALKALEKHDLAVIHIEATDEAAHDGSVQHKVEAIERADKEVLSRVRSWRPGGLRVLVMPDHPTPIALRTHTDEPVPFLYWGPGFKGNGARRFSESEAKKTGISAGEDYNIMRNLVGG